MQISARTAGRRSRCRLTHESRTGRGDRGTASSGPFVTRPFVTRVHRLAEHVVKLRQAEAELAQGASVGQVCQQLGISETTFNRWRLQYGGMKADEAKRLKELEGENARLKEKKKKQGVRAGDGLLPPTHLRHR